MIKMPLRAMALVAPGRGLRNAAPRLARPADVATTRDNQVWRAINSMWQLFKTNYYDPTFQRPDVIEDDYYRFCHRRRG
jgi:hypothetical protein